jgi:hypothetical protein
MAHLQYYCYPGFGEAKREELWYSQAVRISDRIEIAGQGISHAIPKSPSNPSIDILNRRLGPQNQRSP